MMMMLLVMMCVYLVDDNVNDDNMIALGVVNNYDDIHLFSS